MILTPYDDFRKPIWGTEWSFRNFEREVDLLIAKTACTAKIGTKRDYLQAQREFIEASDEFDCELLATPKGFPYLRPFVRKQGSGVIAKLIIYEGFYIGPASRAGCSDEKLRFHSAIQLAKWMLAELDSPSLNFCTVIGEYE